MERREEKSLRFSIPIAPERLIDKMAKLSSFKRDSKVREFGAWVSPGPEFDGLEILTRGLTPKYRDEVAAKMRQAAVPLLGDIMRVPSEQRTEIAVEALINHSLLDVRGISDEDGNKVSFSQFCDIIRNPLYDKLYGAAVTAAAQADELKGQAAADAAGNSAAPSA